MPETPSNQESRLWDSMYGDVKFLVLEYKLRDSWKTKEDAEAAIIQLLQYHALAQQEYWKFIRTLRIFFALGRVLKSNPPDDVKKVVTKVHKTLFRDYQKYIAKFWNWEFLTKRQQAKKSQLYKPWSWLATRNALIELAAKRPNTFRYLLQHLSTQAEEYRPYKPPSITKVLRYMRDIEFDMEKAS